MRIALLLLAFVSVFFNSRNAEACDPCALYNAARIQGLIPESFSIALSNQWTTFDRAQGSGENLTRNGEFIREYHTTQIALAYDLDQTWGFQLNTPVVTRVFDRQTNYRYDTEYDGGIGDISFNTRYSFINIKEADWSVIAGVTGGVKLPTGDSGSLGEVTEEVDSGELLSFRHHPVASASGGRALVLGSGSFDYIMGANLFTRYRKAMLLSDIQYTIRTEGSFDYEFGNDFIWSIGPGYYLLLEDTHFLATRIAVTGEFKRADHIEGSRVAGSAFSNFYVGPELLFSLTNNISGQIGVDFRTTGEDANSTVVPELRLRTALAWRFM